MLKANNRLEEIKTLCHADPTALKGMDSDGWTAGHWAARCGYLELMNFIADR
jgi:hypothetical protein